MYITYIKRYLFSKIKYYLFTELQVVYLCFRRQQKKKEKEQNKTDINMEILKTALLMNGSQNPESQHLLSNTNDNSERAKNRIMSEVSLPTYLKQHEKVNK